MVDQGSYAKLEGCMRAFLYVRRNAENIQLKSMMLRTICGENTPLAGKGQSYASGM